MVCRALVTGASRGIGFHAARAFLGMGCRLVASARGVEGLRGAFAGLEGRVLFFRADLRRRGDVESLVDYAFRELGGLEYVFLSYGNPSREPLELHEAMWDDWVEAFSMYVASTATIIRGLVERNPVKATLMVVSSFTVREDHPELVVSDTARSGLYRLVFTASRRYPGKIRGIILELGSFRTPGALRTASLIARRRGVDPEEFWRRNVEGLSPLGRAGGLEELEEMITLLAKSPEYLTGVVVRFDGASSCCIG